MFSFFGKSEKKKDVVETLKQLKSFKVAEGREPDTILSDGGRYYGDLIEVRETVQEGLTQPSPSLSAITPTATSSSTSSSSSKQPGLSPTVSVTTRIKKVPHGAGVLFFPDGSKYGGEWVNGQMHGKGALTTDAFEYEGEWADSRMSGFGMVHYRENPGSNLLTNVLLKGLTALSPFEQKHRPLEYRGEFDAVHHRHGRGVMTYRNGDIYDGEWCANKRHGQGTFRENDGDKYVGTWVNDERTGEGTVSCPNGMVYHGHMIGDKRVGQGTLLLPNGDEYTGNFDRDTMEGFGICRYRNGDKYEGEWKDGVRQGEGTFFLEKRCAIVRGTFVKGLLHGKGSIELPGKSFFAGEFDKGERLNGVVWNEDGSCYGGEWWGDAPQGKGIMWYHNGDFYYGRWEKGLRHGQGNLNYRSGSEYSGEFYRDMRHGKGIFKSADGKIEAGVWQEDKLKYGYYGDWDGTSFQGIGTLVFPSGDIYFGQFKDGLRHGVGMIRFKETGIAYQGEWFNDAPHGRGTAEYGFAGLLGDGRSDAALSGVPPSAATIARQAPQRDDRTSVLMLQNPLIPPMPRSPFPPPSSLEAYPAPSRVTPPPPGSPAFAHGGAGSTPTTPAAIAAIPTAGQKPPSDGPPPAQKGLGEIYDGGWAGGVRCGVGTIVHPNGRQYTGEWNDDLPSGEGTYWEVDLDNPMFESVLPQLMSSQQGSGLSNQQSDPLGPTGSALTSSSASAEPSVGKKTGVLQSGSRLVKGFAKSASKVVTVPAAAAVTAAGWVASLGGSKKVGDSGDLLVCEGAAGNDGSNQGGGVVVRIIGFHPLFTLVSGFHEGLPRGIGTVYIPPSPGGPGSPVSLRKQQQSSSTTNEGAGTGHPSESMETQQPLPPPLAEANTPSSLSSDRISPPGFTLAGRIPKGFVDPLRKQTEVVVQANFLEGQPKLEMPHRCNNIEADASTAGQSDTTSGSGESSSSAAAAGSTAPAVATICVICRTPFSFFRKLQYCVLCGRPICGSCLKELSPVPPSVLLEIKAAQEGSAAGSASTTSFVRLKKAMANAAQAPVNLLKAPVVAVGLAGAAADAIKACDECIKCTKLGTSLVTVWQTTTTTTVSTSSSTMGAVSSNSVAPSLSREEGEEIPDAQPHTNALVVATESTTHTSTTTVSTVRLCYKGFVAGEEPHVSGTLWSDERSVYHGDFVVGTRAGFGILSHSNGEELVGRWMRDLPDGVTKYRCRDGSVYEGVWKDGELIRVAYHGEATPAPELARHGLGIAFYENGDRYNGSWRHGKRHGPGILQSADGSVYTGEFANGTFNGFGRLLRKPGGSPWIGGSPVVQQLAGMGSGGSSSLGGGADSTLTQTEGSMLSAYVGQFRSGRMHGRGVERIGELTFEGNRAEGKLYGKVKVRDYSMPRRERSSSQTESDTAEGAAGRVFLGVWDGETGEERRDIFLQGDALPDAATAQCGFCQVQFSFLTRRHHCRSCGGIFCEACSKRKVLLPAHFSVEQHAVTINSAAAAATGYMGGVFSAAVGSSTKPAGSDPKNGEDGGDASTASAAPTASQVAYRVCMKCFVCLSEGCSLRIEWLPNGDTYAGEVVKGEHRGHGLLKQRSTGTFFRKRNSPLAQSARVALDPALAKTLPPVHHHDPTNGVTTTGSASAASSSEQVLRQPTEDLDGDWVVASSDEVRFFHDWWTKVIFKCGIKEFPLRFTRGPLFENGVANARKHPAEARRGEGEEQYDQDRLDATMSRSDQLEAEVDDCLGITDLLEAYQGYPEVKLFDPNGTSDESRHLNEVRRLSFVPAVVTPMPSLPPPPPSKPFPPALVPDEAFAEKIKWRERFNRQARHTKRGDSVDPVAALLSQTHFEGEGLPGSAEQLIAGEELDDVDTAARLPINFGTPPQPPQREYRPHGWDHWGTARIPFYDPGLAVMGSAGSLGNGGGGILGLGAHSQGDATTSNIAAKTQQHRAQKSGFFSGDISARTAESTSSSAASAFLSAVPGIGAVAGSATGTGGGASTQKDTMPYYAPPLGRIGAPVFPRVPTPGVVNLRLRPLQKPFTIQRSMKRHQYHFSVQELGSDQEE